MRRSSWGVAAALVLAAMAVLLTGCARKPLVSIADTSAREGTTMLFPVQLVSDGAGNPNTAFADVRIFCTTSDGSAVAGADYVGLSDVHCGTIRAGSRTANLPVQILADSEWETHEDFWLQIRVVGPAGVAGDGRASGLI